jgi:peroxiredoxin
MRTIRYGLTVLASLLVGTGTFLGAMFLMTAITATVRSASTQGIPQVGTAASDFLVHQLDGNPVRLADFRGKPVVIVFWADWCKDCRYAIPDIDELHHAGVEVLAINVMEKPERVARSIDANAIHYPVALDPVGEAGRLYGVHSVPSVFVVDGEGTIVYRGYDPPTRDQNLFHSEAH